MEMRRWIELGIAAVIALILIMQPQEIRFQWMFIMVGVAIAAATLTGILRYITRKIEEKEGICSDDEK
ncbi:MAG: hypothetical protein Q7R79_01535 [bacterium]|nr:hypothetical protein [bacterium]